MARRTRRRWTDDEKRSICLQTTAPGVSVAQVALRYTVNANFIFKWLRDPRYRPKPGTGSEEVGLRFLPVEIVKEAPVIRQMPAADSQIEIEIELAGGHPRTHPGLQDHQSRRSAALAMERIAVRPGAYHQHDTRKTAPARISPHSQAAAGNSQLRTSLLPAIIGP